MTQPTRDREGASAAPAAPQPGQPQWGWVEGFEGAEGPIRHEEAEAFPAAETPAVSALSLGILAAFLLLLAILGLDLINFIHSQFGKSIALGGVTLFLLAPPAFLLAWAIATEWRGYSQLSDVEDLRRGLFGQDLLVAKAGAARWLASINASSYTVQIVMGARDTETLRALLQNTVLPDLDQATKSAGRAAAVQVLAATAVSPWPGLDGLLVTWRGFRLVNQVARIHGLRPGTLGTLKILRRVAFDASGVAATDVVASTVAEALLNSPLAGGLVGQSAGSAVAAQRMLRLSYAVSVSCRPV